MNKGPCKPREEFCLKPDSNGVHNFTNIIHRVVENMLEERNITNRENSCRRSEKCKRSQPELGWWQ